MSESIEFQRYLESIRATYQERLRFYTPTDAAGKQQRSKEVSPFFDFNLIVQMVKREERERQEEEIERLSVLEGLRKYADQQVLLVGRPGSGKSTALARLMLEEATNPRMGIPVLVELRYWQGSIEQLICNSLKRHGLTVKRLEAVLSRLLLLFDGVNELPSEEARLQLSAFRRDHPKLPMIFTTRDLSIGGDLGIEKKLEMQPLSEDQMREFVRAYVPEQAEQMLGQLKDRLRELGQTPLLLWMLCSLFRQTGTIPENLGLVFREFTQGYERYLKEDVRIESDKAWWKPVLQQLAWVMMQGEKPTEFRVSIGKEEAVRAIAQSLDQKVPYAEDFVRKCLRDLQKYHLIQIGANSEELEFRHQLIQEYYAAEALLDRVDQLEPDQLKREFLNFLKWTEPIMLMLALVDDVQAVQNVKLALEVDLLLGARLAGKVQPASRADIQGFLRALNIPDWFKEELLQQTRSTSYLRPTETATRLRRKTQKETQYESIPDEKIIELCSRISNSNNRICWQAVQELETLIHLDSDSQLRVSISQKIIPRLLDLANHENPEIRWCVAHSLLLVGNHSATQCLLKLLKDSSDDVRKSAALALGKIRDENAVPGLLFFLQSPSNDIERADELRGCGSYALSQTGGEKAVSGLRSLLDYTDESVRWYVIDALGDIRDKITMAGLIPALRDSSSKIRSKAAYALGVNGDERAISDLVDYLHSVSDKSDECYAIIDALGEIGQAKAIPVLRQFLNRTEGYLKQKTIFALGKIGDTLVVSDLLDFFNYPNFENKVQASIILSKMDIKIAIPYIIEFLITNAYESPYPSLKLLESLENFEDKGIGNILPKLFSCIPTDAGIVAFRAIQSIQKKCRYYNHEIYQDHLETQEIDRQIPQNNDRSSTIINNYPNVTEFKQTIMSNSSKYNFPNAQKVQIFEQVNTYIENNYPTNPEIKTAIADLTLLLTHLQTQHPQVTTESQALTVLDAEFTEIQQSTTHPLITLRQQLLNPERHLQAIKATLAEVAKHYLEESVWSKAAITYFDKLSETPDQGA